MGGKYSKVANPYYRDLKVLEGRSINEFNHKMNLIYKEDDSKIGIYFLNKRDLLFTFPDLTSVQIHEIIMLFDSFQTDRISSIDFWGGLILLSSDNNDDKLSNCFKLIDTNHDNYIGYYDMTILLSCITRGVALLRGYQQLPYALIERYTIDLFKNNRHLLNPNGEIRLIDFMSYVLTDAVVSQYISALGMPVAEVDAGNTMMIIMNIMVVMMILVIMI